MSAPNPGDWPDASKPRRVIKGSGFDAQGGGFTSLHIDGVEFSTQEILTPAEVTALVAAAVAQERGRIAAMFDAGAEAIIKCRDASPFHSVSHTALTTYAVNLAGWAENIRAGQEKPDAT